MQQVHAYACRRRDTRTMCWHDGAQLAKPTIQPCACSNVKMALKQTLVRVPGWNKQAQHLKSNARPSQITLHIMSHKPVLAGLHNICSALLQ
jgi:hypothetical protein